MTTVRSSIVTFVCDRCGDEFAPDEPTELFREAWSMAMAAGWETREERGGWFHYCEDCCK